MEVVAVLAPPITYPSTTQTDLISITYDDRAHPFLLDPLGIKFKELITHHKH